jgi:hypothetical protein
LGFVTNQSQRIRGFVGWMIRWDSLPGQATKLYARNHYVLADSLFVTCRFVTGKNKYIDFNALPFVTFVAPPGPLADQRIRPTPDVRGPYPAEGKIKQQDSGRETSKMERIKGLAADPSHRA